MSDYQLDYASGRPQMYDLKSRQKKADRMIKTFEDFFSGNNLSTLSLLDIGSSTGIIDSILANRFNSVVGIDIDKSAVDFAQKKFANRKLRFQVGNGQALNFRDSSFDVVVCTHIYEHVPNPRKLLLEIYRVLKPGGVCYFAAVNKLWPIEPHYNLPFLSWLPKTVANFYMRITKKGNAYYETPMTFWGLTELTKEFVRIEYTQRILRNPKKFGYEDVIKFPTSVIVWFLSPLSKILAPTFFWLLIKRR